MKVFVVERSGHRGCVAPEAPKNGNQDKKRNAIEIYVLIGNVDGTDSQPADL